MNDQPFKPILLDLLHQAHLDLGAFLQELNDVEHTAIGTPERWSAKDHIAHLTFWRQRLALKLAAILCQETPSSFENFLQLNDQVFEEHHHRPWSDIFLEAEHSYYTLTTLTQQLREEDLVAFNRFDWIPNQEPLYTLFMGFSYEHAQQHLAQYYLDRQDLPQAIHIFETWANRVIQAQAPEVLKGMVLYNLACFYATHSQVEKAAVALPHALTLAPHLKEFSLSDPDLNALRQHAGEEFSGG
jgi:tetratricopeptide (TPR) repeat protein